MKQHSSWYGILVLLAITFFLGCDPDDDFYPIDALPPSDITLNFTIADDDSGLLTVYPQATGATRFDIYFGNDPAAAPSNINAGESASEIYAEGDYTMRVIAYGITGKSAEITQAIMIRFKPPENLVVDVLVDPVETTKITVTPSADNATLFEIFFGDVPDEDATVIMAGQSAIHTYADSGEYVLTVIARSASSTTLSFTDTLNIIKIPDPLTLPITFESDEVQYNFSDFGSATTVRIKNPDSSGLNTSQYVARLSKPAGAEVWAGSFLQLPAAIDFSQSQTFRVKTWSPKIGATVRLKLENAENGDIFQELDVTTSTAGAWEELAWDFSGLDLSQPLHKIVLFFDFGNPGDNMNYYFDDIFLGDVNMEKLVLPIDFESTTLVYAFTDFGNVESSIEDNPAASPVNSSAKVAKSVKPTGAETWAGTFLELPDPIDFSESQVFSVSTWSPKSGATVRLKIENATDGGIFQELDATTTVASDWEILQWDFSSLDLSQPLHKVVIFFDFGNGGDDSEYFFDDILLGDRPMTGLTLPIDFESTEVAYEFVDFGNVTSAVIANPDQSGVNTSNSVASFEKPNGAETWGGTFLELPEPIDFSESQTFSVQTWSPKSGATVRLKIENATDGGIFQELDATTTTANAWEELQWDFSSLDLSQPLHKVVIFFDFGNMGDGTLYYFDNIKLAGGAVEDKLELPLDFESETLTYMFTDFGNAASELLDNPDASGINTSGKVVKFSKPGGAETWAGTFIELPEAIDFSSSTVVKMKTWSPKADAAVLLKLENATDGGIFQEVQATTTVSDQWEELTFDFTGLDLSNPLHKVVVFFDFGNGGDDSDYYFDDITL